MKMQITLMLVTGLAATASAGCSTTYTDNIYANHFESIFLPGGRFEDPNPRSLRKSVPAFPEQELPMAPSIAEVSRRYALTPCSIELTPIDPQPSAISPAMVRRLETPATLEYPVHDFRHCRRHARHAGSRPDSDCPRPDTRNNAQPNAPANPQPSKPVGHIQRKPASRAGQKDNH